MGKFIAKHYFWWSWWKIRNFVNKNITFGYKWRDRDWLGAFFLHLNLLLNLLLFSLLSPSLLSFPLLPRSRSRPSFLFLKKCRLKISEQSFIGDKKWFLGRIQEVVLVGFNFFRSRGSSELVEAQKTWKS